MHEASIAAEIVRLAEARAAGARVTEVRVRVGALTCVSPAALRFCFEVLRADTLGPQAALAVERPALRARCGRCSRQVHSTEAVWSCPSCGFPALTFENGDELDFLGLVVDDGTADHDRAEDPRAERRRGPGEPAAP
jgi:hydrogenase nickel incorporation protein HypA/HybF